MRNHFHAEIDHLVDALVGMGEIAGEMLARGVRALVRRDLSLADEVMRSDDEVDARYVQVQNRIVRTLALQAPVASDLRLLSAMLHVNIHLERMGDYAVNVARMAKLSANYQDEPELADQLREMAEIAIEVGEEAVVSFAQRDLERARRLPLLDDSVDHLNIGVFKRLVRLASDDESHLEWATHMILVARQIERWSDHAVDIGEATIFAVTGEMVELSSNTPTGSGGRAG
ncbi:MAG: phosphate signaling complex protein PhoU [Nitriliruptorales bacterium]